MIQSDDKSLLIGALLHDIGKFRMRQNEPKLGLDHSTIGAEWAKSYLGLKLPPSVPDLIQWHHRKYWDNFHEYNDNLLVYQADNLAAQSEREQKDDAEFKSTAPLTSILSTIHLENENTRAYWPLTRYDGKMIFPQKDYSTLATKAKYAELWRAFEEDFSQWCNCGCHINGLLVLLERYTSFIPSETLWSDTADEANPDISLFDHMKSTAAIALCMKRVLEEQLGAISNHQDLEQAILDKTKPYFSLVGGDLSGVQNFIYTISSRGALKTLRARSFFLELLCEHLVSQFLQVRDLARTNIIYTGGGRFYLLAPAGEKTDNALQNLEQACNRWLIDQFKGALTLVTAQQTFCGDDFRTAKMSVIWQQLNVHLNERKRKKYGPFLEEMLTPQEPLVADGSCQVCHRDDVQIRPAKKDENITSICAFCEQLLELGSQLPRCKYIVHSSSGADAIAKISIFPDMLDQKSNGFYFYDKWPNPAASRMVYRINEKNSYAIDHPNLAELQVSLYARRQNELQTDKSVSSGIANFEELAQQATGKAMIAVLRMDVDNLGAIFQKGIHDQKRTFTRLAALSRQFSLFFKSYLDVLLQGQEVPEKIPLTDMSGKNPRLNGRNAAVVYSGGDDLFLVGAWDEIAEISIDIHHCFTAFSGNNKDVTLSGGFIFQRHDFPLYKLADLAHAAEKAAKDNGKNRLALFYDPGLEEIRYGQQNRLIQTVPWKDMEKTVLEPLKKFLAFGAITVRAGHRFFDFKDINKSELGRLYQIMRLWEKEGVMYLPAMAYILGRTEKLRHSEIGLKLMKAEYIANLRNSILWLNLLSRSNITKQEEKA